jgi:hypothetical protein
MASSAILKQTQKVEMQTKFFPKATFLSGESTSLKITDLVHNTEKVQSAHFSNSKAFANERAALVSERLPFRVRITNLGVAYGPSHPAPIGIAILGLNNYIL